MLVCEQVTLCRQLSLAWRLFKIFTKRVTHYVRPLYWKQNKQTNKQKIGNTDTTIVASIFSFSLFYSLWKSWWNTIMPWRRPTLEIYGDADESVYKKWRPGRIAYLSFIWLLKDTMLKQTYQPSNARQCHWLLSPALFLSILNPLFIIC